MARLDLTEETSQRYEELRTASKVIVAAGFAILRELEADRIEGAVHIYADQTSPTLNAARANAYTLMSELERGISLAALKCR